jgi:hypothetical protein
MVVKEEEEKKHMELKIIAYWGMFFFSREE